jgi:hypothetical protein
MQCPSSSTGKLRMLLARAAAVMMDVDSANGRRRSFRVLLPVLGAPSLGNHPPSSLAEVAEVFNERDVRNFSVSKLEFRILGNPPINKIVKQNFCAHCLEAFGPACYYPSASSASQKMRLPLSRAKKRGE